MISKRQNKDTRVPIFIQMDSLNLVTPPYTIKTAPFSFMVSLTSSFTLEVTVLACNLSLTIAWEALSVHAEQRSLLKTGHLPPCAALPRASLAGSPIPTFLTTSAHLQFENFLLFQLHPSLLLLGPLGLDLSLPQLLGLCFELQPSYPAREKEPRMSGAAGEPSPAHPASRLSHRSSCSLRFSSRFQAISSWCSLMASCALRSARTPARASCNFPRTSNVNSRLGEDGLQVSTHPPAPALPRGRRRPPALYTHLRARTVSRYCR